jgi:hypothetical protein
MDDRRIETHPDLMDPDWRKHAEREAWTEVKKSRRRSKRGGFGKPAVWVTVGMVVLVGGAIVVNVMRDRSATNGFQAAGAPTASPTTAPSVLPEAAPVDLAQPFASTPAALWKDGVDGFTVPEAAAVGSFSAKQVTDAYGQVKQAVSRARLDRATLEGHDTTALLSSFAPSEASRLKPLLDKPDKVDASAHVTLIADGFHLLPTGPRLKGKLTAQPTARKGELTIHAEYVIAYAFDTPHPNDLTSPSEIVAFLRGDQNYTMLVGSGWHKADLGLSFGASAGSETFSMACGAANAGYLAPLYSELTQKNSVEYDETKIYDLDKPLDLVDGC